MLADAHIHFIPEEVAVCTAFFKGVWSDKQKLYEFLERENIEKALLVYPSTDAYLKLGAEQEIAIYNQRIAEILRENSRIIGAGLINPENLNSIGSELKELKEKRFQAVSIASSYRGKFIVEELKPLFAAAQEQNLAIFIHPQTINPIGLERLKDPLLMPVLEYSFDISACLGLLMMSGILEEFEVKFIFSSLAGVAPYLKERFDRIYAMLRAREMVKDLKSKPSEILKKVYVDTSGASLPNIRLALDLFGEEHLLWGSDYPVNGNIEDNLNDLEKLGRPTREKITRTNLLNLFE